jgi:quercetin dioxygenase-like cupin family protein
MPHSTISRSPLLTAHIGAKNLERVEIQRISLPPNQATGAHVHPCPVVGIIISGSVHFQVEDNTPIVLERDSVFFEPADTTITCFDAEQNGAVFIAYYLLGAEDHELIKLLPTANQ